MGDAGGGLSAGVAGEGFPFERDVDGAGLGAAVAVLHAFGGMGFAGVPAGADEGDAVLRGFVEVEGVAVVGEADVGAAAVGGAALLDEFDFAALAADEVEAQGFVGLVLAVDGDEAALDGHGDDVAVAGLGVGELEAGLFLLRVGGSLGLARALGGFALEAALFVEEGLLALVIGLLLGGEGFPLGFGEAQREGLAAEEGEPREQEEGGEFFHGRVGLRDFSAREAGWKEDNLQKDFYTD